VRTFPRLVTVLSLGLAACGDPPTTAPADCVTDEAFFAAQAAPLLSAQCVTCHVEGGLAGGTRHVLVPFVDDAALAENMARLGALVRDTDDGAALLLQKPTGQVPHVGGARFDTLSPEYAVLHELVARLGEPGACEHPGEAPPTCEDGVIYPASAPLRRLTDAQVRHSIMDLVGVELPDGLFPATTSGPEFRTFANNNTVTSAGVEGVMLAAEHVSANMDLDTLWACGADEAEADCARRFLLDLGERAWRRPLTAEQAALITRFLDAGVEPREAAQMGVELIFQAPYFLYLDATPGEAVPGGERLDDWAIAARLSYFLLDTTPDETLRAAAAAGQLRTRAQVAAQAERLVSDPRVVRAVISFHQDWLNTWRLDNASRDATLYPTFDDETIDAMRTELDLFVSEVVWSGDARFETLLFSEWTWVNAELAAIYGLPDPGEGWSRAQLDPSLRPGALTRLAFLTGHGYAASSSPVKRGAFVLEELLCQELAPPQDVNMDLPAESEDAETIRERLQQHWTDASCAGCHTRIDPLGLSMEHYGATGEWRDSWESGIPVDASGTLDDPAGSFDGAAEMVALIGGAERARACYVTRWAEYALGRAHEEADACSLRVVQRRFEESDGDIRALLVDLAVTDAFLIRATLEETP
jgi:hypothetical protein